MVDVWKYIVRMKIPSPVSYVSAILLIIFTAGVYKQLTLTQKTANNCEMTFMFEYPHFVEISVPMNRGKYNLYAYTEGQTMEKIKSMKFYGTPVIFIPGHSGSYRQVRSIASVNIRKMYHIQSNIKFDFFTVDLNEEYSAVFGGVLLQQTAFVSQCIDTIIKTYEYDYKPTSIILIGHSMGGIIAKGLFIDPSFDTNLVELIITLATPHRPLFLADHYMDSYYDQVEKIWGNGLDKPRSSFLSNISLLSIGGGHRDLMVWPCLTYTPHADINALSLAIPGVWTSTDHQCILWCKSLVKSIVRVLFDSAESDSDDTIYEWRKKVSSYHFDKRSNGKWFHSNLHPTTVKLNEPNVIEWNETYKLQRSISLEKGTAMPIVIHLPLFEKSFNYEMTAEAVNIEYHDWVFSCKTDYHSKKHCLFGTNWSSNSTISVSKHMKRRHITLNLPDVYKLGHSNLVFKIKNTKKPTALNIDLYEASDRTNQMLWRFWYGVFNRYILWNVNVFETIQYKTILHGWPASICMHCVYNVHMIPIKCSKKHHHAVSKFIVPWTQGILHGITSDSYVEPLRISLENIPLSNATKDPYLQFILDPKCNYHIELELSIMDTIGTIGLKYGLTFPSYIGIIILLVLSNQFSQLANSTKDDCSIYHNSLPSIIRVFKTLAITICFLTVMQNQWPNINKPIGGIDWLGHPLKTMIFSSLLYCITNSFMYFATVALWMMMLFWGKAINELLVGFIMKTLKKNATLSDWILYGFGKLPIAVSMIAILISYNTCGTVGLVISAFFYYFLLCTMVQDCIDQLIYYPIIFFKEYFMKGEKPGLNLSLTSIHIHFSLFLLWLLICGCHLPCSIEWARNYHHSKYLDPDPSLITSLILNTCAGILWQMEIPKRNLKFYAQLSNLCIAASIILFLFCQTALFRIAPILTMVFVIITLHQCFSSWIGVQDLIDNQVSGANDKTPQKKVE
ncbi:GPI inositol-deacylase isoform X2 [Rhopalosiphum maidis]|uniref:GPI inositol-deacylase isoform X2 n=1 Tax=Rhopalosiphum maidis TaxID=43146 RepID=UPI000EFDDDC4|nr:GPI inositol-deacylase isoform X2 [Rhopalosiphum maidis]XP_026821733.1 GPI inositol-deacylase isoform X2 [Rhopalosiphum maidis]